MNVLIVKLGATGDVVRTTPLLRRLSGSVTWITAAKNGVFLEGLAIPVDEVLSAVMAQLDLAIPVADHITAK
jgi:ADP-heptose:LPS heptosyltransferase